MLPNTRFPFKFGMFSCLNVSGFLRLEKKQKRYSLSMCLDFFFCFFRKLFGVFVDSFHDLMVLEVT